MTGLIRHFIDRAESPSPWWARATAGAGVFLVLSLGMWAFLASVSPKWGVFWEYREVFWRGWLLTIGLSLASLVLSTIIGVTAALARRSGFLPVRYVAKVYIELVRGMPFLVLIFLLFYGIPEVTKYGDRFTFGVVALSLFAGSYIAEIVRSGLESIGAWQWESARAIGLSRWQTYRYILLPQVARVILPAMTGQLASLIKDSSLLSVIGLMEFTQSAQQVFSATYSGMESFLPLGVGYLLLTLPIVAVSRQLEKKLRYEH